MAYEGPKQFQQPEEPAQVKPLRYECKWVPLRLSAQIELQLAENRGIPIWSTAKEVVAYDNIVSRIQQLEAHKDNAYAERNNLVAALARLFPSSLERHPDEDETWEDDWRWIVFINLPTGQASWHIHDSELEKFSTIPRFRGWQWDGHTTEQKYERLAALGI